MEKDKEKPCTFMCTPEDELMIKIYLGLSKEKKLYASGKLDVLHMWDMAERM